MNHLARRLLLIVGGILIGGIAVWVFVSSTETKTSDNSTSADEPLYWVAPMDPNFRRDKPGKSPMGMDLVPVYAEDVQATPGTVRIDPNVVNNLGVRTAQVTSGTLQVPIRTVGYVQYNQDTLVHIHPRVEGWVDALYVKAAGEKVAKNQPIYSLYSPQLVNAQEEYLLALARQNQVLSTAALARLNALQMPEEAIAKLKSQKQVMQTVTFRSPQAGVIDNLNIREGFFVKPDTTMMSIGALASVWVEAEVFERLAGNLKVGLPVSMTLDYLPARSWLGKVDYVYPTLDEKTRTLRARLLFDNADRQLKPNMFAQVEIMTDAPEASLLVPYDAVIRTGSQSRVVLALGDGEFKSVEVKLGQVAGDKAQILSGLQEGDEVVTSAQFLIDSESSVDSDFQRMTAPSEHMHDMHEMQMEVQSAQVTGVVNHIDLQTRVANVSRDAIEKWNRGPATLDFSLEDNLAIADLKPGTEFEFIFEIREGDFVITEIIATLSTSQGAL